MASWIDPTRGRALAVLALVLSASCLGETAASHVTRVPTLAWAVASSVAIVLVAGAVTARRREIAKVVIASPFFTFELLTYRQAVRGIGLAVMVLVTDVVLGRDAMRWLLGPLVIACALASETRRDQSASLEHWLHRLAGKWLAPREGEAVLVRLAMSAALAACVGRVLGASVAARVWVAACGLFAVVLGLWCVERACTIARMRVVGGDDPRAPRLLPGEPVALVVARETSPYRDRAVIGAVPERARLVATTMAITSGVAAVLGAIAMLA
ncbi:hypothetical protein [Sandaracinus amylolyticus]|uniref:Uncharacterized protein n=1 Tax=Sandaracinus amylolyticus TaxID=927083 RepID=A0A0F6VZE4_9BACT|nr:hypothetical protein [Sandaracinus amylolyticus]AKF03358.1 hypothetical protein DB32_000507 [Sandaracinus amylolyticus]